MIDGKTIDASNQIVGKEKPIVVLAAAHREPCGLHRGSTAAGHASPVRRGALGRFSSGRGVPVGRSIRRNGPDCGRISEHTTGTTRSVMRVSERLPFDS